MANQNKLTPLEQMNQILSDKEAVIDKKLNELKTYRKELAEFETQLQDKVVEIKNAQANIAIEKEAIKNAWDEIHSYEKNLQNSMEKVLEEKVLIEQRNMSELKRLLESDEEILIVDPQGEWKENHNASGNVKEFNLNALREAVGIDVGNFVTNNEVKAEEAIVGKKEEAIQNVPNFGTDSKKIPTVFLAMEKEIQKSYPKWTKLEMIPERYCVQFGEKEIRFFDADEKSKVPRVEIIVFRKNARADRRLQGNIAGIERVATDWSISTEENQIVCTMHFGEDTKASVVLKKCNEFIKNHLN